MQWSSACDKMVGKDFEAGLASMKSRRERQVTIPGGTQKGSTKCKSNPYLFYNGTCEAAFKFYAKVLGAKIETMLTQKAAPEPKPDHRGNGRRRSCMGD